MMTMQQLEENFKAMNDRLESFLSSELGTSKPTYVLKDRCVVTVTSVARCALN